MLKRFYIATTLMALLVVMAGCGGSEDTAKPKPAEKTPASSPAPVQLETETPEPAEEMPELDGAVTIDEADDAEEPTNDLVGTKWQVGEFTAAFKDNTTVFVQGGPIADIHPDGVEGIYTLDDGVIEVQIIGQTRVGTWDGEKLIVDGAVGERLQ